MVYNLFTQFIHNIHPFFSCSIVGLAVCGFDHQNYQLFSHIETVSNSNERERKRKKEVFVLKPDKITKPQQIWTSRDSEWNVEIRYGGTCTYNMKCFFFISPLEAFYVYFSIKEQYSWWICLLLFIFFNASSSRFRAEEFPCYWKKRKISYWT